MKQRSNKIKVIVPLLVVILLLAGGVFIFARNRNTSKTKTKSSTETVNYAPASPVEKKETEDNKDRIVAEQNQNKPQNSDSNQKKSVTPTIVNADANSTSAYITGIFEEDGTCTATFTKGSITKTKTSQGFGNVSYTQCAPIDTTGLLGSGSWTLVVSYSSNTAQGSSASREVMVP